MNKTTAARVFFGVTAACVLAGIVIQIPITANATGGHFDSAGARVFNIFCFFTILSNLLVGATTLQLALHPDTDGTGFRVVRLAGVVQIFVTGVVYWIALDGLVEAQGWAAVSNYLVHLVVPVLGVAGWAWFGPRGHLTTRIVALSMTVPIAWLVFTLIRGPIVEWYPYPFLDVIVHGYATVLVNVVIVAALYLAFAFGALALDRRLPSSQAEAEPVVA